MRKWLRVALISLAYLPPLEWPLYPLHGLYRRLSH